jgi:hypothetical protein
LTECHDVHSLNNNNISKINAARINAPQYRKTSKYAL